MIDNDLTPDDETERIARILAKLRMNYGAAGLIEAILTPERRFEEAHHAFSEGAHAEFEAALEGDTDIEGLMKLLRTWTRDCDAVHALELVLLEDLSERIGHAIDTSGESRTMALMARIETIPDWLAPQAIQSEIDYIEGSMGVYPDAYTDLLILYQTLGEYVGMEETRETRKELWDEALKYTTYEVNIDYRDDDERTQYARYEKTRTASHKAHNDAIDELRNRSRDANIITISTTPTKLHRPDVDPANDIAEWVTRFW